MAGTRIVGAAITAFGKIPGRTLRSLAEEAVRDALADAALEPAMSRWCSSATPRRG